MNTAKPEALNEIPAWVSEAGELRMSLRGGPEGARRFAITKLAEAGIRTRVWTDTAEQLRDKESRVAHDAAWLRVHADEALTLMAQFPAKARPVLRILWAHAFHAGERHANIRGGYRHLKSIQHSHAVKVTGRKAREAAAAKRRAFTDEELRESMKRNRNKQAAVAAELDVKASTISKRWKKLGG